MRKGWENWDSLEISWGGRWEGWCNIYINTERRVQRRWSHASLSDARWQDQRQWALTETPEVSSEHQGTVFIWKFTEHQHKVHREIVESPSLDIQKLSGHGLEQLALGVPAWAGELDYRWCPAVPSNMNHFEHSSVLSCKFSRMLWVRVVFPRLCRARTAACQISHIFKGWIFRRAFLL